MSDDARVVPAGHVAITNERTGQVKHYETVASRLSRFRAEHAGEKIDTIIIECNDEKVVMRVEISYFFEGSGWTVISSAHAEEYRMDGEVNATSALENCETSALGRALSFLGYGSADSIATAEEVIGAKRKGEAIKGAEPGALILLQNAAKAGSKSLKHAWEVTLSKNDRVSCKGYMAELKRDADKADREKQS